MRLVKGGVRVVGAPLGKPSLFRAVAGLALVAIVPAGVGGQSVDPDYDRSSPSGSPVGRSNQNGQQNTTRQPTALVDPTGGAVDNRIEPDRITGSDRVQVFGTSDDATISPRLKAPAPPNEFETYVENAIGRRLPRFGADLLLPSNRDYAVPAMAAVPPAYVLNVGDVVSISLTGSAEGSVDKQIDTDGKIFLPKVGSVMLAGVRYADLKDHIAAAIGRQYRHYDVTVGIRQLRGIRVYVSGFANNPGAYTVNSLSTMVNAVLAAGGPSAGGSFRSVRLFRQGQLVSDFDLYDFIRHGDRSRDAVLQNGDVLVIPALGAQVAVTGSVNQEAIYEGKPGETIKDILGYTGGFSNLADKSRVILYRLDGGSDTGGRQITVADTPTVPVIGGDLVQVLSEGTLQRSMEHQSVMVRIEGEVNKPGNYFVPANTTLGQAMALAGGATQRGYVYGTRLERNSVRRQQREAYAEAVRQFEVTLASAPLTGSQALDASERASQLAGARAVLDRIREAQPDGRIVLDLPPTASDLPADLVLENNDRVLIPARATTVGVFGAVYRPASFLFNEANPPRVEDYVERAGGPIRAADKGGIFVVRANGSVLSKRNGALHARVLPGDVIFVPVKVQSNSFWARLQQITAVIAQLGFSAATLAVLDR